MNGVSLTVMSPLAASPTPTPVQEVADRGVGTGVLLVGVVLVVVAVVFLFAWLGKYRGKRAPIPRPVDQPFRPS